LPEEKTRSLLVIAVLSFTLAMLITIPPSITASQAATQETIDSLTATAQAVNATISKVATQIDCHLPPITVPNAGPNNETIIEQQFMNITEYANITTIQQVKHVIPILDKTENDSGFEFNIYGLPLDDANLLSAYSLLLAPNITEGRNLEVCDSGVVVLQERVADYFGVDIGGTVTLLNQTFQVIGIDGFSPLNKTAVYMSLNEAQTITNNTGKVSNLKVFIDNVNDVESVAEKISIMYPKLSVSIAASLVNSVIQMQNQTNEQLQAAQATMKQIESTGMMEIGVVTTVNATIVLFIMMYTVRERTREIGTLKALGASSPAILGQFMLEGIFLSLIAGIGGIVIGTFGATSLANLLLPWPTQTGNSTVSISVAITPELTLFGIGLALLLGALGSLYPAWRAARTRPAEAMRYE
jgi:putative ABC transport system permease protein